MTSYRFAHLTCHSVATLPWEIQQSHFLTLLFIYFRLFMLAQKKTKTYSMSNWSPDTLLLGSFDEEERVRRPVAHEISHDPSELFSVRL